MDNKEVIVKISANGQDVEVEASGFVGGGCKDFTKQILDALGTVDEEKLKPEYFDTVGQHQKIG